MDRRSNAALSLTFIVVLALLLPVGTMAKQGGGKPPPTTETTNNLSFPAIAVDGFTINGITGTLFTTPYTGDYPGLTAEQILDLQATGPWYAQKVTGNVWQADYLAGQTTASVTWIDWGDNIESVNPVIRRPFRLEVVLFRDLLEAEAMTGYTMAVLGNPSSPDEIQGTNTVTYESLRATVISNQPRLAIQYLGDGIPALTWDADMGRWVREDNVVPAVSPVGFAPELNVAGKYIYGASSGGWKPTVAGYYRITFYIPTGTGVDLTGAAVLQPLPEEVAALAAEGEGGATPVVDAEHNLSYVDVHVDGRTRTK